MPPQPMIPTSIAMAAPFAPSPPASSGVATSWPPAAPRGVCHQAPGILPVWKHGRAPRAGGRTFVHKPVKEEAHVDPEPRDAVRREEPSSPPPSHHTSQLIAV